MARTKKDDPLDGAVYWNSEAVPTDYMNGPEGIRPDETKPPNGVMTSNLETAIGGVPLPPRSIWKQGEWKDDGWGKEGVYTKDYQTWVVNGEGTPGNYLKREYVLPMAIASIGGGHSPKHPSDWPKNIFSKVKTKVTTTTSKAPVAKAPALPTGIRFRCPHCGHWYREMDLAGHAKVCPGQQEGISDWAIACECCHSLDDTAACKDGYPRTKKEGVTKDGGGTPAA